MQHIPIRSSDIKMMLWLYLCYAVLNFLIDRYVIVLQILIWLIVTNGMILISWRSMWPLFSMSFSI